MRKAALVIALISIVYRAIPAQAQTTDPAYLSQFPSAKRIRTEVKGTNPLDTAARQLGALSQFRQVIYRLAAAQHRDTANALTADEKQLAADYSTAYTAILRPIDKSLPDLEQRQWYYLHHRYEIDRVTRDRLFKQFFTSDFRDTVYKTLGETPPAGADATETTTTSGGDGSVEALMAAADRHKAAAEALAKKGDKGAIAEFDQAIAGYKRVIALNPMSKDAYASLCAIYLNDLQQYEPAVEVATQLRKRWPDDLVNAALLALAYDGLGKDTEALREYQASLEIQGRPSMVEFAERKIGEIEIRQGQIQEGLASLQKALQIDPKDANAEAELGVGLYLVKRYPEAVTAYQQAIEGKPEATEYLADLGYAYVTMGQKEAALQVASKLDATDDRSEGNDIRGAVKRYLDAPGGPDLERSRGGFYQMIGERLQQDNQHLRAIGAYQKAVEIDPTRGASYLGLALCLNHVQQYEQAIPAWKKAIALMPPNGVYYAFLGTAYMEAKKYPEAIEAYRAAIKLKPDPKVLANVYLFLGDIYNTTGGYQDAVTALRESVQLNPQEAQADYELGVAYAHLKQYADAASAFRNTVALRSRDAIAYRFLGLMYVQLGQKDEAMKVYDTLKTIDQGQAEALRKAME